MSDPSLPTRKGKTFLAQVNLLKLALQALAIVLALGGIALWPIWHWSNQPVRVIVAMTSAGLICLVMATISLIPVTVVVKRHRQFLIQACLASSGIRLLLTLVAALLVYALLLGRDQRLVFALWTCGFYLVLLVWETITALRISTATMPPGKDG